MFLCVFEGLSRDFFSCSDISMVRFFGKFGKYYFVDKKYNQNKFDFISKSKSSTSNSKKYFTFVATGFLDILAEI